MPAIVKYNPWSILRGIQGEVNQLFDVDPNNGELPNMETSQWSPKVDIKEEASQFIITADLPGINPKDIEISMENNVLSIKGVRKLERNIKEDNYSRMERFSGSFYRQFTLPDHVNSEAIQAKGKHGVLEILIPKKERHVPKKISVQADE